MRRGRGQNPSLARLSDPRRLSRYHRSASQASRRGRPPWRAWVLGRHHEHVHRIRRLEVRRGLGGVHHPEEVHLVASRGRVRRGQDFRDGIRRGGDLVSVVGVRGASPDAPAAESTFISSIDPSARGIARDRARDSGETASSTSRRLGDEKIALAAGHAPVGTLASRNTSLSRNKKISSPPPLASALSTRASPVYREFSPLGPSKCLGRSSSSPLSAAPPRTRAPAGNSHAVSIVALLYQ